MTAYARPLRFGHAYLNFCSGRAIAGERNFANVRCTLDAVVAVALVRAAEVGRQEPLTFSDRSFGGRTGGNLPSRLSDRPLNSELSILDRPGGDQQTWAGTAPPRPAARTHAEDPATTADSGKSNQFRTFVSS
jgi:hypothetical protein